MPSSFLLFPHLTFSAFWQDGYSPASHPGSTSELWSGPVVLLLSYSHSDAMALDDSTRLLSFSLA